MSLLSSVITNPTPNAPKGIWYGGPGVGKTTAAAGAPNHLIIDCENGAGTIHCQRTPYLETWSAIEQWLSAVEKEKHTYKVIVIDTIDWLVRRIEEHVSGVTATALTSTLNKSHGGYGNGKQVLKNYISRSLLPTFDRIVSKGTAVLLLAHARRTDVTDIDGVTLEKTAPDLPDEYINIFVEWSDFVCLARKDGSGKRSMETTETARAIAKNRYSMPPVIDFAWDAFTGAISAGLSQTMNTKKGA